MNEPHPSSAEDPREVSLDPLIPGCRWRVAKPYHLPIEAGIRAEQARLAGKRWLVVASLSEYDADGLTFDTIRLDAGFDDENDALARAHLLRAELVATTREKFNGADRPPAAFKWPKVDALSERPVLRVGEAVLFYAPNRWSGVTIQAAVLPIDPTCPITAELADAISGPYDLGGLKGHFEKIGESLGVYADPPRPPPRPAPLAAPSEVPRSNISPALWWLLSPLAGLAMYVLTHL